MFTGIVEEIGEVVACEPEGEVQRLALRAAKTSVDLPVGGSVAVNGCCLTATAVIGELMRFDLAPETVARTRFDERLRPGGKVNLERPLRVSSRLDGHFVQGHVDGVATVEAIREAGSTREITFEMPGDLARYCIEKGSIAVDGVSLTCAHVTGTLVRVALIPHTLAVTTLGRLRLHDLVNVEVDMIAKYVEKLVSK
ncbi:MAG: riboflavin synthase [Vicinamibacteria bacterium]|nr:riboflavin synthase [Vicinamibacteria bacterium]